MRKIFSGLVSDSRGVALIEFAFVLPLLILFLVGIAEFGRYILIREKVINTSAMIAQYVTQLPDPENPGNLDAAVNALISPFSTANVGYVVSVATKEDKDSNIKVELAESGPTGKDPTSKVDDESPLIKGLQGQFLPNATNSKRDQAIIVEIFYNYNTLIPGVEKISSALNFDSQIYNVSLALTRKNNAKPQEGVVTPIPDFYGCCGEYCGTGNTPTGVECRPCFAKNGRKPCAKTDADASTLGIPVCDYNCPTPKPCDPAKCTCTGTCPPVGG